MGNAARIFWTVLLVVAWLASPTPAAAQAGAKTVLLAPSDVRSASWNSRMVVTPIGARGVIVILDIESGTTPSIDMQMQLYFSQSDAWSDYTSSCGAKSASGACSYTNGATGGQHLHTLKSGPIPGVWRLQFIHGNGNAITYNATLNWLY